jgi:type IV pilus assembly protein PilE
MKNAVRKQAGFTLLELMITVAVVAILSTIAYGSYQDQIKRSRRAAAATCLQERAQFMERFYTTNMSYEEAPDPAPCDTVAGHYAQPTLSDVTANSYTLEIAPIGTQETNDTQCATLSLTSTGVRAASGTYSSEPAKCW